jgi:hypothetical protein
MLTNKTAVFSNDKVTCRLMLVDVNAKENESKEKDLNKGKQGLLA